MLTTRRRDAKWINETDTLRVDVYAGRAAGAESKATQRSTIHAYTATTYCTSILAGSRYNTRMHGTRSMRNRSVSHAPVKYQILQWYVR